MMAWRRECGQAGKQWLNQMQWTIAHRIPAGENTAGEAGFEVALHRCSWNRSRREIPATTPVTCCQWKVGGNLNLEKRANACMVGSCMFTLSQKQRIAYAALPAERTHRLLTKDLSVSYNSGDGGEEP